VKKLDPQIRQTLAVIKDAAFANPYSENRLELDRRIIGAARDSNTDETLQQVVTFVGELYQVLSRTSLRIRDYGEPDRELIKIFVMFHLFHSNRSALDEHIDQQFERPHSEPLQFKFGAQIFSQLREHGLLESDAERAVAIMFQLRRAFRFIEEIKGQCDSMRKPATVAAK
jgi:hypothetical protein